MLLKLITKNSTKSYIKSLKKLTKKLAKFEKKGYNNNRMPNCVIEEIYYYKNVIKL